jgi:acetylglutamate kinase
VKKKIEHAKILMDALPYIKKFNNKIVVIKYGGSAQSDEELKEKFAQDIVLLYLVGLKPVIVHGGGKKISLLLDRLDIDTHFKDGIRVTSHEAMEVVEMVLSGNINKEITSLLNKHGARAIGITGKDANFIKAKKLNDGEYGLVGEIVEIDDNVVRRIIDEKFVPVIAPIASSIDDENSGYNINADLAASQISIALKAHKIIFMTDTLGVLDNDKKLLSSLSKEEVVSLKYNGTIQGGMITKVDACLEAIEGGVKKAHIIDGRIEHSILLELFTSDGIGTIIG